MATSVRFMVTDKQEQPYNDNIAGADTMMEKDSEKSLLEVADWIWSSRWLIVIYAIAAAGWVLLAWQNNPSVTSFEIKLQIFSGGTPVRAPGEVADILVAGLAKPGLQLVSTSATNPVVFRTTNRQLADSVEEDVSGLVEDIMKEVSAQQIELARLLPTNNTALPQFLSTKAFIEGVNSGLISLVVTTISSSEASVRSRGNVVLLPLVVCSLLFFLTAGATTLGRHLKKRRGML